MGPYRHLDVLQIREPCPESFDEMKGDGPMRFCDRCEKNVYDLSALTPDESAELLSLFEGSVCLRLWRRQDGTLINADCTDARKLRKRRRVIRLMASGAATVGLVAATFGVAYAATPETHQATPRRTGVPAPLAHHPAWVDADDLAQESFVPPTLPLSHGTAAGSTGGADPSYWPAPEGYWDDEPLEERERLRRERVRAFREAHPETFRD